MQFLNSGGLACTWFFAEPVHICERRIQLGAKLKCWWLNIRLTESLACHPNMRGDGIPNLIGAPQHEWPACAAGYG